MNLPFDRLSTRWRSVTGGWQLSGITRITTGFPVTLHEDGDNSLQGSSPNGVNNHYLDTPDYTGLPLDINANPRNGQPYFNPGAFTQNALGEPGTASRRSFFGPGMFNFDLALLRNFHFREKGSLAVPLRVVQHLQPCAVLRPRRGAGGDSRFQLRLCGQGAAAAAGANRGQAHVLMAGAEGCRAFDSH